MLAGDIILSKLGKLSRENIDVKQASDFVTSVDRESELIIIETIRKKFPGHRFLAEESLREVEDANYRWIIDPLDGTTNYIHGYPVFSLSIALEFNGEIILGVIFDPLSDEIFTAETGKGAFLNGKPVRISTLTDLTDSLLATGFPFRKRDLIDPYLKLFKNIFNRVSDIRRAGSAALDLAYVASGRCEGFFEIGLGPWDIAAGSLLIKEAGGIVTDFGGGNDFLLTGNIVAAAPAIHGEILKEVKAVFQGAIDR
ncbi:MAG: inositol monophosphatase [Nitrospiraceae bacterium]|nr:MAG: inositol monophosphatase [Nitrospiraceae bacterium]